VAHHIATDSPIYRPSSWLGYEWNTLVGSARVRCRPTKCRSCEIHGFGGSAVRNKPKIGGGKCGWGRIPEKEDKNPDHKNMNLGDVTQSKKMGGGLCHHLAKSDQDFFPKSVALVVGAHGDGRVPPKLQPHSGLGWPRPPGYPSTAEMKPGPDPVKEGKCAAKLEARPCWPQATTFGGGLAEI